MRAPLRQRRRSPPSPLPLLPLPEAARAPMQRAVVARRALQCRRRPRRRNSRWRSSQQSAARRRQAAREASGGSKPPCAPPTTPRRTREPLPRPAFAAAHPSTRRRADPGRAPPPRSRSVRELREVGFALLDVRVATFLGFLAHVVEESRVARELLHAGESVGVGVESRFDETQREWAHLEHAVAHGHRLLFELVERDDSI